MTTMIGDNWLDNFLDKIMWSCFMALNFWASIICQQIVKELFSEKNDDHVRQPAGNELGILDICLVILIRT